MPEPRLVVIAGARGRSRKPRSSPQQDDIVKRWRLGEPASVEGNASDSRDVIPLLDGWIRRLEREAGGNTAESH